MVFDLVSVFSSDFECEAWSWSYLLAVRNRQSSVLKVKANPLLARTE